MHVFLNKQIWLHPEGVQPDGSHPRDREHGGGDRRHGHEAQEGEMMGTSDCDVHDFVPCGLLDEVSCPVGR